MAGEKSAGRASHGSLPTIVRLKHDGGQGRKNLLDYHATLPSFSTPKSATLLTTEQQLSEAMHRLS